MRKTARIVLGFLFVFSGIVKAVDPVGFSLILTEYFHAFHVSFLDPLALTGSIGLSAVEFLLGIMLLLDFRKQWTAWGVLLFMVFFTLLTLYLALFNPVSDCGCFGEAVTLTNWQTFFKNLLFLPFAILLFVQRKRTPPVAPPGAEWPVCAFFAVVVVAVSIYSYRHLPLVDFRGFKVGNDIAFLLEDSRTRPEFLFKTELIYSKDGKQEVFEPENLPDSSWTFVASHTKEIKTGVRHKITDFSVFDSAGLLMTDSLLQENETALLLLFSSDYHMTDKVLNELKALVEERQSQHLPVYAISALPTQELEPIMRAKGIEIPIYRADRTLLLTMIRSSPGVMVLKKGVVVAKYGFRDIPTLKKWKKLTQEDSELVITRNNIHTRLRTQLFVVILLVLVYLIRKGYKVLFTSTIL